MSGAVNEGDRIYVTGRRRNMSVEHELDANGQRTGRTRPTQFRPTFRWQAIPPSQRTSWPFEASLPISEVDRG